MFVLRPDGFMFEFSPWRYLVFFLFYGFFKWKCKFALGAENIKSIYLGTISFHLVLYTNWLEKKVCIMFCRNKIDVASEIRLLFFIIRKILVLFFYVGENIVSVLLYIIVWKEILFWLYLLLFYRYDSHSTYSMF